MPISPSKQLLQNASFSVLCLQIRPALLWSGGTDEKQKKKKQEEEEKNQAFLPSLPKTWHCKI